LPACLESLPPLFGVQLSGLDFYFAASESGSCIQNFVSVPVSLESHNRSHAGLVCLPQVQLGISFLPLKQICFLSLLLAPGAPVLVALF
jgi:hypothetical protein